jgi:hypothetical protein
MQEQLIDKFQIDCNLIRVIKPSLKIIVNNKFEFLNYFPEIKLFYPATPYSYKNHSFLIHSLSYLPRRYVERIRLIFTFEKNFNKISKELIKLQKKYILKINYV